MDFFLNYYFCFCLKIKRWKYLYWFFSTKWEKCYYINEKNLLFNYKRWLLLKHLFEKKLILAEIFRMFNVISFLFSKHTRHWFHYIWTSYLPLRLHHPLIISTPIPFSLFFTLLHLCLCRYKFNLSDAEKKTQFSLLECHHFSFNMIPSIQCQMNEIVCAWIGE